jgi:hypothetical protein
MTPGTPLVRACVLPARLRATIRARPHAAPMHPPHTHTHKHKHTPVRAQARVLYAIRGVRQAVQSTTHTRQCTHQVERVRRHVRGQQRVQSVCECARVNCERASLCLCCAPRCVNARVRLVSERACRCERERARARFASESVSLRTVCARWSHRLNSRHDESNDCGLDQTLSPNRALPPLRGFLNPNNYKPTT